MQQKGCATNKNHTQRRRKLQGIVGYSLVKRYEKKKEKKKNGDIKAKDSISLLNICTARVPIHRELAMGGPRKCGGTADKAEEEQGASEDQEPRRTTTRVCDEREWEVAVDERSRRRSLEKKGSRKPLEACRRLLDRRRLVGGHPSTS
jgi:hypothetical protein